MPVIFNRPVSHPEQPQGRVATQLRELVDDSDIASSAELRRRTNYAGSTLSEALGGRKRQNRQVITKIVEACVADREEAEELIEELMSILETQPPGLATSEIPEVTLRAPSPAETAAVPGTHEEPLDPADAPPGDQGRERSPAPATEIPEQAGSPASLPASEPEPEPEPKAAALAGVGAATGGAAALGAGASAVNSSNGVAPAAPPDATPAAASTPAAAPAPPASAPAGLAPSSPAPAPTGGEVETAVAPRARSRHWWTAEYPADGPESEAGGDGTEPPGSGRQQRSWGPWRRWLWVGGALVLVLAVIATVVLVASRQPMCGPGVAKQDDGQCIGVTDGSVNVAADPTFDALFTKIRNENARVLGAPDHLPVVSVAYTAPFPASHTSVSGQLLRELAPVDRTPGVWGQ